MCVCFFFVTTHFLLMASCEIHKVLKYLFLFEFRPSLVWSQVSYIHHLLLFQPGVYGGWGGVLGAVQWLCQGGVYV